MTQKELTDMLSEKTGMETAQAERCLDTCARLIAEALADGSSVSLQGFGNFDLKEKGARRMFNPTTRSYKEIPAKWTAGFRPSPVLKEKIKNLAGATPPAAGADQPQEKGTKL